MKFKKTHPAAKLPTRQTDGAAGYDLHIIEGGMVGELAMFDTGVAVKIPDGHVGLIRDRSGMAAKQGITVLAGVVDSDYTGSIKVVLTCTTGVKQVFDEERVAQLVVVPCVMESSEWVSDIEATPRGDGGFGSTGRV